MNELLARMKPEEIRDGLWMCVPIVVALFLKDKWPGPVVAVAAAMVPIPVFFGGVGIARLLDGLFGRDSDEKLGITLPGLCFVQGMAFFYLPMALISPGEDGDAPILDFGFVGLIIPFGLAGAAVWAGLRVKKQQKLAADLSRLANSNPDLATKFLTRLDKKSWAEIQPANVLKYQMWFEKALTEVLAHDSSRNGWLTTEQQKALAKASRDARYDDFDLYPWTIAALVLTFLHSTDSVQKQHRRHWSTYVATSPNASERRESVRELVSLVFPSDS